MRPRARRSPGERCHRQRCPEGTKLVRSPAGRAPRARASVALRLGVAVAVTACRFHAVAASVTCSSPSEYVDWVASWAQTCRPASPGKSPTFWFDSCDWVSCKCIHGLALAPVPAKELAPCFQEVVALDTIDAQAKLMITALMRTCRSRTDEFARPCGRCDNYRQYRECDGDQLVIPNTTATAAPQITPPSSRAWRRAQPAGGGASLALHVAACAASAALWYTR
eukprot:TRINITY_DN49558_c0_g1_i1.p2 TRINITY_DN49558_c0_g1~~TRINITY_DN49558_c0_g1_i1.p2  ORF type:complete len:224 (-),score=20.35 TRINITY_DN49558_c0_g1_i1:147-818(-)